MSKNTQDKDSVAIISKKDLPLYCPSEQLWNTHPRVYIPVKPNETVVCPYCSNKFKFIE